MTIKENFKNILKSLLYLDFCAAEQLEDTTVEDYVSMCMDVACDVSICFAVWWNSSEVPTRKDFEEFVKLSRF